MKSTSVLVCGLILLFAAVVIRWNAASWATDILLDPQMTSSTKPVYLVDAQKKDVFIATSEGLGVLGIILTSIAVFRLTERR
jgi:hypothetical protein